jgi:hypothetical protein
VSGSKQIHVSSSSRGITDHFFCFTCDEYVWDCDHLLEDRLNAPRETALEPSLLQSFAFDGKSRVFSFASGRFDRRVVVNLHGQERTRSD